MINKLNWSLTGRIALLPLSFHLQMALVNSSYIFGCLPRTFFEKGWGQQGCRCSSISNIWWEEEKKKTHKCSRQIFLWTTAPFYHHQSKLAIKLKGLNPDDLWPSYRLPQIVWINASDSTLALPNTWAPQGCCLGPTPDRLLFARVCFKKPSQCCEVPRWCCSYWTY